MGNRGSIRFLKNFFKRQEKSGRQKPFQEMGTRDTFFKPAG